MAQILNIIEEVISNDKQLSISLEGKLISVDYNYLDKFKNLFGFNNDKQLENFLINNKEALYIEAEEYFKEGKSLSNIQDFIDSQFNSSSEIDIISHVFSNWMSNISETNKNKKVIDLILPGTHDSAAYKLDWSNPINDKNSTYLTKFSNALKYTIGVNKLVENWTITQNESIEKQLNHGIRMLDLRVSYDELSNKFFLSHTFAVEELEPVLAQMGNFLKTHPSEFLTISLTKDWEHRKTITGHEKELKNLIDKYISPYVTTDLNISYNNAIKNHTNSFLFSDINIGGKYLSTQKIHSNDKWQDKYDLTSTLENLCDSIQDSYKNYSQYETINFAMTPNIATILGNLSLHNATNDLNSYFDQFIDSNDNSIMNMSGITMDFPDYSMIEKIINLNMQ